MIELTLSKPKKIGIGQPSSEPIGDQLKLFAQKQLRPVWHLRQEVEEHLVKRTVLKTRKGYSPNRS